MRGGLGIRQGDRREGFRQTRGHEAQGSGERVRGGSLEPRGDGAAGGAAVTPMPTAPPSWTAPGRYEGLTAIGGWSAASGERREASTSLAGGRPTKSRGPCPFGRPCEGSRTGPEGPWGLGRAVDGPPARGRSWGRRASLGTVAWPRLKRASQREAVCVAQGAPLGCLDLCWLAVGSPGGAF